MKGKTQDLILSHHLDGCMSGLFVLWRHQVSIVDRVRGSVS